MFALWQKRRTSTKYIRAIANNLPSVALFVEKLAVCQEILVYFSAKRTQQFQAPGKPEQAAESQTSGPSDKAETVTPAS
jgi:hypothetical protein